MELINGIVNRINKWNQFMISVNDQLLESNNEIS